MSVGGYLDARHPVHADVEEPICHEPGQVIRQEVKVQANDTANRRIHQRANISYYYSIIIANINGCLLATIIIINN